MRGGRRHDRSPPEVLMKWPYYMAYRISSIRRGSLTRCKPQKPLHPLMPYRRLGLQQQYPQEKTPAQEAQEARIHPPPRHACRRTLRALVSVGCSSGGGCRIFLSYARFHRRALLLAFSHRAMLNRRWRKMKSQSIGVLGSVAAVKHVRSKRLSWEF
jgi:hypothetical protein